MCDSCCFSSKQNVYNANVNGAVKNSKLYYWYTHVQFDYYNGIKNV